MNRFEVRYNAAPGGKVWGPMTLEECWRLVLTDPGLYWRNHKGGRNLARHVTIRSVPGPGTIADAEELDVLPPHGSQSAS
jgi:hypothetical protein